MESSWKPGLPAAGASLGARIPIGPSRKAYAAIYHEIYVRILSGRIRPGERLPSERQLAAQLGVSRPTVREALSALESRGLVVTRVGSGTFVTERGGAVDEDDAQTTDDSPLEFLEARLVLEVATTRVAAKRAGQDPEALDLVLASVQALEQTQSPEAFPDEIDQAFHRSVAALTGNDYLTGIVAPIWDTMMQGLFVTLRSRSWSVEETRRTAREHRAIYEALRLGDPDLAEFEMERHLRGIIEKLFGDDSDGRPPPAYVA